MSEDPRDVRVRELEAEVAGLTAQVDALQAKADETDWLQKELDIALSRIKETEIKLRQAERENKANKASADAANRDARLIRQHRDAPALPPLATEPQPLREAPPSGIHGSMADVLGFPKEGR